MAALPWVVRLVALQSSAMQRSMAALLGGVLLASAFPPFDWVLVGWLAVAGLVWLLTEAETRRSALLYGYLYGVGFFGGVMWWIANVELVAFFPLILLEASGFLVVAWFVYRWRDAGQVQVAVAAGGSWALMEFVRVRWPFGGFPWATLGLSISATPLRSSAQWIGASGWSVLIVSLCAVAVLWIRRRRGAGAVVSLVAVVVLLGVFGLIAPATADGEEVRVAMVQGNSPCPGTRCLGERVAIYEAHLALTRQIEPGSVDLVVWPESSTGFSAHPLTNPAVAEAVAAEAVRIGAPILVGGDRSDGEANFINSNAFFDERGVFVGEYRKVHPVPFGEFVPFRPLLDWIPPLARVPRDMTRGSGPVLFDLEAGPIGSVISYEGAFARYERQMIAEGARLLIVATNEASYGDSPASDQFLAISRVRAAEFGTDIVQVAVTGKSAIISASGELRGVTGLFESALVIESVSMRSAGPTLYSRIGDLVATLTILALGGAIVRDRLSTSPRVVRSGADPKT